MKNEQHKQPQNTSQAGLATLLLHHSITVLILIMATGLGTWAYLTFQKTDFFATVDRSAIEEGLRPTLEASQKQRLEAALQVYLHMENRYPGRLTELLDAGLLLDSDLYYPRGPSRWFYERRGDSFLLERRSSAEVDPDEDIFHNPR